MADVLTISTGTVGTAGNVSGDMQTYFDAKLLSVAEFNCILNQFGRRIQVPANSSRTAQFNRLEKLATTTTQLTEGVTPDAVGLSLNIFQAVLEQYGAALIISDIAVLTAKNDIVQQALHNLGLQAAESYDILVFGVLDAATNVYRPNSRTSDTTITATDQLAYADLLELQASLRENGGRPYAGNAYVLVVAPQVGASIKKDPDFEKAAQFKAPEKMWRGEVGELGGCSVVESNSPAFEPTTQSTSGASDTVYSSFAIAQEAYQISDFQSLQTFYAAPGGQADLLHQRHKLGWKFAFKAVITEPDWIVRVRSAGLSSTNV